MNAPSLQVIYTKSEIASKIDSLAREISEDYLGSELILIGILKGAFVFLADLMRQLTVPVQVDFVRAASYGDTMESHGNICLTKDLELPIAGRDLLVVEDIVDSGRTLEFLLEDLRRRGPRSVKTCVLLDKRQRREIQFALDYVGFVLEEGFVVGYGLDCAESYRYLPDLCVVKTD
jgi:hypoxanthine phosphoribosyltransferase